MLKQYELMLIAKTDPGEEKASSVLGTVKTTIESFEGKELDSTVWGKRKFAYEINHDKEGFYEVKQFEIDSANLSKLKTKLNLVEGLIRYLIISAQS